MSGVGANRRRADDDRVHSGQADLRARLAFTVGHRRFWRISAGIFLGKIMCVLDPPLT